jgi:hypothetical protein
MATFDISDRYSATYTYEKIKEGWRCPRQIWDRSTHKPTHISFEGRGRTKGSAANRAAEEARRVCPS